MSFAFCLHRLQYIYMYMHFNLETMYLIHHPINNETQNEDSNITVTIFHRYYHKDHFNYILYVPIIL